MNQARGHDGTRVAWEETGRGPGVVLLHSLGTDSEMWKAASEALSDRYRVVRTDLRGHGRSEAPAGPYTVDMLGSDLLAVADAAALDRFHLVGISLGGQVALWAAIHHPHRLSSVLLSNTAARIGSREGWEERVEAVRASGMEGISEKVVGGWFSAGFADRHPDRWKHAVARFEATDPEGYIGCCGALAEADLRGQVGSVSAPTMIVTGGADSSTPPTDAEWLHLHISGSRLEVMDGCAHLPNLEKPEEYSTLLRDWFETL